MNQPEEKEITPPAVTISQNELASALADLECLANSGGLSNDDIAEVYQARIDELAAEE